MDKYKIEMPKVEANPGPTKWPNLIPFLVRSLDSGDISTVIITNCSAATWFEPDGSICQSDIAYLNDGSYEFLREYKIGETLSVTRTQ